MMNLSKKSIKALLLANALALFPTIPAYADSSSTVTVSVTIPPPLEMEIKIIDPQASSPARWERVPPSAFSDHTYTGVLPTIISSSSDYNLKEDFSWLDYVPPTREKVENKKVESEMFYASLENIDYPVMEGSTFFKIWKNIYKGPLSLTKFIKEIAETSQPNSL